MSRKLLLESSKLCRTHIVPCFYATSFNFIDGIFRSYLCFLKNIISLQQVWNKKRKQWTAILIFWGMLRKGSQIYSFSWLIPIWLNMMRHKARHPKTPTLYSLSSHPRKNGIHFHHVICFYLGNVEGMPSECDFKLCSSFILEKII